MRKRPSHRARRLARLRGRRPTLSPLVASRKHIVHVADPLAEEGLVLLRARCEVRQTAGLKESELASRLADVDGLIVRSETKVTAAILEAARCLQVVGRAGVGVDNIDLGAATARGVYVVNAPLGNIVAAAEHTLALALALVRRVVEADRSVRAGEWTRAKFIGRELRGAGGRKDRRRRARRLRAGAAAAGGGDTARAADRPDPAHRGIDGRGADQRRGRRRRAGARRARGPARALRGERTAPARRGGGRHGLAAVR